MVWKDVALSMWNELGSHQGSRLVRPGGQSMTMIDLSRD